ncbi:MAG: DNA repair protein RadC [Kiritimatiellae bacterium]|nr:DNA repair protein RadC [Kiritimatiellia bacterium]
MARAAAPNAFKERAAELKPRERIEAAGTASVASAAELLAIILKTGAAGCDVMELARRLIDAFGGVEALVRCDLNTLKGGIAEYNRANPQRRISGLGRVKALELSAVFELARRGYSGAKGERKPLVTPDDAAELFRAALPIDAEKETFMVLPLDVRRRPMAAPQVVAVGTVSGVGVHPRDVFSIAVRWNAHSIVVAHNHPSGSPAPSKRDDELTAALSEASRMMGIPLIDHIVLGAGSRYSYAERGALGGDAGRK